MRRAWNVLGGVDFLGLAAQLGGRWADHDGSGMRPEIAKSLFAPYTHGKPYWRRITEATGDTSPFRSLVEIVWPVPGDHRW